MQSLNIPLISISGSCFITFTLLLASKLQILNGFALELVISGIL